MCQILRESAQWLLNYKQQKIRELTDLFSLLSPENKQASLAGHLLTLICHFEFFQKKTKCTQREQNARLHVTSLSSDIKYCKESIK